MRIGVDRLGVCSIRATPEMRKQKAEDKNNVSKSIGGELRGRIVARFLLSVEFASFLLPFLFPDV